jgi:hypothetical protein
MIKAVIKQLVVTRILLFKFRMANVYLKYQQSKQQHTVYRLAILHNQALFRTLLNFISILGNSILSHFNRCRNKKLNEMRKATFTLSFNPFPHEHIVKNGHFH